MLAYGHLCLSKPLLLFLVVVVLGAVGMKNLRADPSWSELNCSQSLDSRWQLTLIDLTILVLHCRLGRPCYPLLRGCDHQLHFSTQRYTNLPLIPSAAYNPCNCSSSALLFPCWDDDRARNTMMNHPLGLHLIVLYDPCHIPPDP